MQSLFKKSVIIFVSAISQTMFAQSQLDREFTQLQEQKEKALAAAVEPVNRRYQAALEALLRRATQAGDLPTANKVDTELKSLTLTLPSPKGQATVKSVTET
ncbi:MAG: hypothetical protein CFE26_05125, partial [Verrucomicrobiales bacterium VVV1]